MVEKYNDSATTYFEGKYGYTTSKGQELGNLYSGDGPLFRGAGYIHITGRYNYQQFANYIGDQDIMKEGYELIRDKYAWDVAGWFWNEHHINSIVDNLTPGDRNGVDKVTDIVNPGDPSNSREARKEVYDKMCAYIK